MSRHFQNLQGLRAELEARYGKHDEAVVQVALAVKSLQQTEARSPRLACAGSRPPEPESQYGVGGPARGAASTRPVPR